MANTLRITGSSQDARAPKALQSDYVQIEERSVKDWLGFSMGFADMLTYTGPDNAADGTWGPFFGKITDENVDPADAEKLEAAYIDAMAAFLENPESFNQSSQYSHILSEPHRALHLAFLDELMNVRTVLNDYLPRHLDYYYQQVLGLENRSGEDDQAHLIIDLAAEQDEYLLPAGTIFVSDANDDEDSQIRYRLPTDELINRAQLSELRTLHIENEIRSFETIHEGLFSAYTEGKPIARDDAAFLEMIKWSCGVGAPGADLPPDYQDSEVVIDIPKLQEYYNSIRTDAASTQLRQFIMGEFAPAPESKSTDGESIGLFFAEVQHFMAVMSAHERQSNAAPPSEEEWQRVYGYLEQAFAKNYGGDRSPELKKVIRLKPQMIMSEGARLSTRAFAAFGDEADGNAEDYAPGFYVTSPILLMKEGAREITLTLTTHHIEEGWVPTSGYVFDCYYSAGAKFVKIADAKVSSQATTGASATLTLSIKLDAGDPPLLPPSGQNIEFVSDFPVLKICLKQSATRPEGGAVGNDTSYYNYDRMRNLEITDASLYVHVEGFTDIKLSSDAQISSPEEMLTPFGEEPVQGSVLSFTSEEFFSKPLTGVHLYMNWVAAPDDFAIYYANYVDLAGNPITINGNGDFTAALDVWDRGAVIPSGNDPQPLFPDVSGATQAVSPPRILPGDQSFTFDTPIRFSPMDEEATESDDPFDYGACFQLRLANPPFAFLHDCYLPSLQAAAEGTIVNEPYTPRVQNLSLNYSAEGTLLEGDLKIYQAHPFGALNIVKSVGPSEGDTYYLLPQYDGNGQLFIGFSDMPVDNGVNTLFQMEAGQSGTANLTPPDPQWRYLREDSWIDDATIVTRDESAGLKDGGLLTFSPPQGGWPLDVEAEDATSETTDTLAPPSLMGGDGNLTWLSASMIEASASMPKCRAIMPQAIRVVRDIVSQDDEEGSEEQAAVPVTVVPPGIVASPLEPIPEIATISQPYASFGGKSAEEEAHFKARVSERLRHRRAAVSGWDAETLVLENFPAIYLALCLPQSATSEPSEARAQLVVVPDLQQLDSDYPLTPQVPYTLRMAVADYLSAHGPAHVQWQVINPAYEELRYRADISVNDPAKAGFYARQLNEDIAKYISPWIEGAQQGLVFGREIYRAALIDFIQKRDYVQRLNTLELVSQTDLTNNAPVVDIYPDFEADPDAARPAGAAGILVSASNHDITVDGANR